MKYKLPRPLFSDEINRILTREIRRQEVALSRLKDKNLKQIAEICKEIVSMGLPKDLVCKKLPHHLGSGIFLNPKAKAIPRGEVIGSYAGEVNLVPQNDHEDGSYAFEPLEKIHLTKEEQLIYHKKAAFHATRNYSLLIDAIKKGNFTRYINHSEEPNVVAALCRIPAKNSYGLSKASIEVIYFSKKIIRPGEQLLVSYEDGEKSYWKASKIKPFVMTPKTFQLSSSLKLIVR